MRKNNYASMRKTFQSVINLLVCPVEQATQHHKVPRCHMRRGASVPSGT